MSDIDLIFLVQLNGSGPTAGKDKALINAHVSRQAHNRRRKRAQQASIDSQQVPKTHALLLSNQAQTKDENTSVPRDALDHEQKSLPIPPVTAIGGGNSDPFDALQHRIDSRAHRYLSFGRDALEVAIHGAGWRGWVGPSFHQKQYVGPDLIAGHNILAVKTQLQHPVCFMVVIYGVLAYCASGIAAIMADPGAREDALRYAIEGMKCMKKHLEDAHQDVNRISEELVYRLFRAEVIAGNHTSALIHGQLLKIVLEHKSKSSGLRLDILSNALFQNGHWMFSSWTRSIFDPGWVAEQYRLVWDEVDGTFENEINLEERDLNGCIKNHHLRKLSFLTKRLFLQSSTGIFQKRQAPCERRYSLAARCEWLQMMWMEYYLDCESIKLEDHDAALEHEIDMCLTLSALYVLRHAKNDPFVNGRPLYGGSLRIFQKLYARLCKLFGAIPSSILESQTNTLIYVFYVNAVAAAYVRGVSGEEGKASLCYLMLKENLSQLDVDSWPSLLTLLETFPFAKEELPKPYPGWCEGLFQQG